MITFTRREASVTRTRRRTTRASLRASRVARTSAVTRCEDPAERDARARVARDLALDEVLLEAIPDAEALSLGRVDVEGDELADAERVVATELLLEGPALGGVARAEDLERDVGRPFLPHEVRIEVIIRAVSTALLDAEHPKSRPGTSPKMIPRLPLPAVCMARSIRSGAGSSLRPLDVRESSSARSAAARLDQLGQLTGR